MFDPAAVLGATPDELRTVKGVGESLALDLKLLHETTLRTARETVVRRWEPGLPHPRPGRHLLQPALEQPLGAVHLAGDYLGTTYIETAIETGTAAAQRIRSMLETSEAPSPPSIG